MALLAVICVAPGPTSDVVLPIPARRRDVLDYGGCVRLPTPDVVVRLIEQAAPVGELDL